MGKKSGRKENSRHCGEKNVVSFFATVLIRKKQILSHLYLLNRRQNQPPPE